MRRAAFLDRDGVLIGADLGLLPGVDEAVRLLAAQGLTLVVVTNQPDVARGAARREDVEVFHGELMQRLPLRAVLACYHDDGDDCGCRKPRPGLLLRAAAEHGIDLGRSFMVGDRWRDVEAGRAAGCVTFLLNRSYSERERCMPDHEAPDLKAAAEAIAGRIARERP